MPPDDFTQLEGVRLSHDGVAEMDGKQRLIFVPRADIETIELKRGSAAERPLVTAVLGLVLIGIALAAIIAIPVALTHQEVFPTKALAAVVFVVPGWWLLDLAFRPRFFLLIRMHRGTRKLVFHKTKEPRAIEAFVSEGKARHGYV